MSESTITDFKSSSQEGVRSLECESQKNKTDLGVEAEKQLGKAFTWPRVGVLAMSGKEKTFHIEEKACAKALG